MRKHRNEATLRGLQLSFVCLRLRDCIDFRRRFLLVIIFSGAFLFLLLLCLLFLDFLHLLFLDLWLCF